MTTSSVDITWGESHPVAGRRQALVRSLTARRPSAGAAFLVAFVFAVVDEFNQPVRANLAPLMIGFVVVAVGISFGANAGYAINPARDFGPRVFADIAGYGKVAIPGDYGNVNSYMWIPIVGPFLGGLIGAFVYDLTIHDTLLGRGEVASPAIEQRGETIREE